MLVLAYGKIHTLDRQSPQVETVAIANGRILAIGSHEQVMNFTAEGTQVVDLQRHTVTPGLNDSHLHLIHGELNYNLELRWEGVPSLADALHVLKDQTDRILSPQWVHVMGGWSESQFTERHMPTLEELNKAAPGTPAFVLHLYDQALFNRAALKAVGHTKAMPDPAGGEIVRDSSGDPTEMLIAKPNAMILYSALAKGPKLPPEVQVNSAHQFTHELNRLGLTSAIDADGGFQNYPEDYEIIEQLRANEQMTMRITYNLFIQHPKQELEDFERWTDMLKPGQGTDFCRANGAEEMPVFSAADFEGLPQPRPDLPEGMEDELERVARHLVGHRQSFHLHTIYDKSINRMLDVFEKVNRDIPFNGLCWFFDHAGAVTERNAKRVKALDGGIAIQYRMTFQGEYFIGHYGKDTVRHTPPMAKMLATDVPARLGTNATRIAGYNPWTALYWLVSGRIVGEMAMYDDSNRLPRDVVLELWTADNARFSNEQGKKGHIEKEQPADLMVLSRDYFSVSEEEIKGIESMMTVVNSKVVCTAGHFTPLAPPAIPIMPDWSPVMKVPGHYRSAPPATAKIDAVVQMHQCCDNCGVHGHQHDIMRESGIPVLDDRIFWGTLGCSYFAF